MAAHGRISNETIMAPSISKMWSRLIGLPGNVPETFAVTMTFPSRSAIVSGSTPWAYFFAVSVRQALIASSPSIVFPSSRTMASGQKHSPSALVSWAFSPMRNRF